MGTRSLTVFVDASWDTTEEIAVMYRQFDGYPSCHGKELHAFLSGMAIINGIPGNPPPTDTGLHRIQTAYDRRTQQIATEFKRRVTDRQPQPHDLAFDDLANYLPEVRRG